MTLTAFALALDRLVQVLAEQEAVLAGAIDTAEIPGLIQTLTLLFNRRRALRWRLETLVRKSGGVPVGSGRQLSQSVSDRGLTAGGEQAAIQRISELDGRIMDEIDALIARFKTGPDNETLVATRAELLAASREAAFPARRSRSFPRLVNQPTPANDARSETPKLIAVAE